MRLWLMGLFMLGSFAAQAQTKSLSWTIKHTEWTRTHHENWREFVAKLGEGREKGLCRTTDECLKHPQANPLYFRRNPSNLRSVFADCADLPHILLAYFSWMNDLPFSYQRGVSKATWKLDDLNAELASLRAQGGRLLSSQLRTQIRALEKKISDEQKRISKEDIRYTVDGNSVRERRTIKNGESINEILNDVVGTISTATYRIHANKYDSGTLFKDFYHVGLNRESIQPGTILYDPAGHIAVVYKVTDDGRVLMIDAHPDNSLTRVSFGEKFSRSPDVRGAGFVNFRPQRLVGASLDPRTGNYVGGRIEGTPNRGIQNFSLEQFYGNVNPTTPVSLRDSRFRFENKNVSYHDYVRRVLSRGKLIINPVNELKIGLNDLCLDLNDRNDSVEAAIKARIHEMNAPERLPENIYGTHGTWETYSTPSRDARFKSSVKEIYEKLNDSIEKFRQGSNEITTDHTSISSLKTDLMETYLDVAQSCVIDMANSRGRTLELSLDDVLDVLFKISFDPYHCVELRWGQTDAQSIQNCGQNSTKMNWYNAQQRLRQTIERDYTLRMDYTVRELPTAPIGDRVAPEIGIKKLIQSL